MRAWCRRNTPLFVASSGLFLVIIWVQPSSAQDGGLSARDHFLAGVADLRQERPEEAERHFREALTLEARASTALNLALVLHERGAVREAMELFEELLGGSYGDLPPTTTREEIAGFLAEASADLARVTISSAFPTSIRVIMDGAPAGTLVPGATLTLQVDPGPHRLVGRSDSHRVEKRLSPGRGEHKIVRLEVPVAAPEPEVAAREATPGPGAASVLETPSNEETAKGDDDNDLLPWLWAGTGVAVVVSVVVLAVALSPDDDSGPREGPFPVVKALVRSP